jgi:stage V sporulation protein D (sporulation-specific penicillin-binding protein)
VSDILEFPKKKKKPGNRKSDARLPVLYLALLLIFGAVGTRLVQLQVVEAQQLDKQASEQRSCRLEIAPDRGRIYDRNGEVLAISVDMDTIYATPYLIENTATAARKIARVLKEDPKKIYKKLTRKSGFEYLRRKADRATALKIKKLKIPGIGLLSESQRFYPFKNLASHTIGFVGLDNKGLSGLELAYDDRLRGKPGSLEMEKDMYGRPIPGTHLKSKPPTQGRDLVLTIDKEIQYKAQVELKKAVKKSKAVGGWIVVMDSKTGEIYALADEPTYDLNNFAKTDPERLRNRAVADVYEPGSTMKIVTAAAALEEGICKPETAFSLPGSISVGGYTIHDAHQRGEEMFTFAEIVEKSSNIGAATLGKSIGKEKLYEYISKFGMNGTTGIESPGESQGYIPEPDQWSASTLATVSFGQGISATALEMARAVNVVAADGQLVEPRIIRSVIDSNQSPQAINREIKSGKRVITADTAKTMANILYETVETGTGTEGKIPGYTVAGKTGTAQKPKTDEPGYAPGKYIASFVGFTPVEDPVVTILVAIDEPQGVYYGGTVAAPVFAAVGEYALQRLKIMP